AYTIQYYVSALVLWLTRSPAVVCGLRQVLFLAATTLPAYALAARVSRRVLCGHVAGALTVSGVLVAFGSYYPLFIWPDKSTSGHIGMGAVLLTLYLIVSGRLAAGFFLAGLMPAIHVGQAPVLMAVAGLYAVWRWVDAPETRRRLIHAVLWGVAGLAISVGVWLALRMANAGQAGSVNVMTAGEVMSAWRSYVFGEDIHRAFARFNPPAHGYIALGIAVFLGLFAAAGTLRAKLRDPASWLGVYAIIAGAVVVSISAAEYWLGPATPPALVVWMPKRLLNHAAVIALALAVGILGRKKKTEGGAEAPADALFVVALAWIVLTPVSAWLVSSAFHAHYVKAIEGVVFLLAGGASSVLYGERRHKRAYAGCLIAGTAAIAYYHQFGAGLLVAGFGAGWVAMSAGPVAERLRPAAIVAGLCLVVLAISLAGQWRTRVTLPVSAFEASVRDYLDAHACQGEFLLTPHWEIDWQEKTDHPVLYTYELPQYITYMPGLAPDILKIRADIYDIRLGLPWDYSLDAWRTRTNAQWKTLAAKYGFRHVLSPKDVTLDLRRVLTGEGYNLYTVE
ncbi:MAG: hypothetical protein NTZ09_13980, partial [Candidatus Hydrogenedentes bacterium]|nr:hypothetical protein [Candidatus Hydrogenedentota bacterium]